MIEKEYQKGREAEGEDKKPGRGKHKAEEEGESMRVERREREMILEVIL